jgi:threonine dehydrogenase-like Zn-dependent dehydrogenase
MKALLFQPTLARAIPTKLASLFTKSAYWSRFSPLILGEVPLPELPSPEWVLVKTRLAGVCGSDMAAITLKGNLDNPLRHFVSFPMFLGHEIVGEVERPGPEVTDLAPGERVAVYPLLSCAPRGIFPPCPFCRKGDNNLCQNLASGDLPPGQAIGVNNRTGGGFSEFFVAHRSQLFRIPEGVSDEEAVLLDPLCVALHAVLLAGVVPEDRVLVIGAGIIGLAVIQMVRALCPECKIYAVARHPFQKDLALQSGADRTIGGVGPVEEETLARELGAKRYGSWAVRPFFLGGFEATFDCVGSADTVQMSLAWSNHRGRVVLVGSSPPGRFEWSLLYWKEIRLLGAMSFGRETVDGQRRHAFDVALAWMADGRIRTDLFPVRTFRQADYREALRSLFEKGTSRVVKVAFDFR